MNEVVEYIKELNQQARQRMAEDPKLWIGELTENPAHWESYGIETVDQLKHYFAVCTYCEIYKSTTGCKPRWIEFDEMTWQEVETMVAGLVESEKPYQQEKAERERRARVAKQARLCKPTLGDVFGDVLKGAL